MLLNTVHITQYNAGRWILNTPEGRNVLLNRQMYQLVEILRTSDTMGDACRRFNETYESQLSEQEFESFVQAKLGGYAVLTDDRQPYRPYGYVKYLKLKVQLINGKIAGILSSIFIPLFTPALFWTLFALMLTSSFFFISYAFAGGVNMADVNWLLLTGLVYSTMFIHELGHIAACRRFGMKHGGIGFGVYLIFPVVYADITGIWHATKQQRLIANLAGIFNEYVYAFCCLGVYYYTGNNTFLTAYIVIASKAIFELNPFVRMDGYWVLSDLTNTPNLMPRAHHALRQLVRGGIKNQWKMNETLLLAYALGNYAVVMVFAVLMWSGYQADILVFPNTLWSLGDKAVNGSLVLDDFKGHYLLIILFYYLLMSYGYTFLLRPLWKRTKQLKKQQL